MKIKDEVATILSGAVECEGPLVRITGPRLDRKQYEAVNQVLEALGGKWQRGTKKIPGAHHFPEGTDAQALLDQALTLGEVTTKQEMGFFETPPELARKLVEMAGVRPGWQVLEPEAGTGRIVRAIVEAGGLPWIFELDPEKLGKAVGIGAQSKDCWVGRCSDFLEAPPEVVFARFDHEASCWVNQSEPATVDACTMNPPFCKVGLGDHLDHVRHAFTFLRPGGVLVSVLPVSIKWRKDRRYAEFRTWYEALGGEVTDLPEGSFKESGTMVRTCVLKVQRP